MYPSTSSMSSTTDGYLSIESVPSFSNYSYRSTRTRPVSSSSANRNSSISLSSLSGATSAQPPPNLQLLPNSRTSNRIGEGLEMMMASLYGRNKNPLPDDKFPPTAWNTTTILDIVSQPNPKCSICLTDTPEDPTAMDSCTHTYCFACLKRWSQTNPVCPLCKRAFGKIFHRIKSEELYTTCAVKEDRERSIFSREEFNRVMYPLLHRRYMYWVARFELTRSQNRQMQANLPLVAGDENRSAAILANCAVNILRTRRILYQRHLLTERVSGVVRENVGRSYFANNVVEVHRVFPFIRREIIFLFGYNSKDLIMPLTRAIIPLLGHPGLQSDSIHQQLIPVLGSFTGRFLNEITMFVRTEHDVDAYDCAHFSPNPNHELDERISSTSEVELSEEALGNPIIRNALGQQRVHVEEAVEAPLASTYRSVLNSDFVQTSERLSETLPHLRTSNMPSIISRTRRINNRWYHRSTNQPATTSSTSTSSRLRHLRRNTELRADPQYRELDEAIRRQLMRGESRDVVPTEVVDLLNVEDDDEPIDLTTSTYINNPPTITQHQPINLSLDVHPSTSSYQQKRCDVTSRVVMAPPSGFHCRKRNRATSSSDVIDLTTFADDDDDDDVTPSTSSAASPQQQHTSQQHTSQHHTSQQQQHQVGNNSPHVMGIVSDVGSDVDEGCDVNHDVLLDEIDAQDKEKHESKIPEEKKVKIEEKERREEKISSTSAHSNSPQGGATEHLKIHQLSTDEDEEPRIKIAKINEDFNDEKNKKLKIKQSRRKIRPTSDHHGDQPHTSSESNLRHKASDSNALSRAFYNNLKKYDRDVSSDDDDDDVIFDGWIRRAS